MSREDGTTTGPGLATLVGKLGGKLIPLLFKLIKSIKFVKLAFTAASFASWDLLASWQFAILLLFSLFVHESGHIWAMKRCGMKTKGIYFVPFWGAVALADDDFPSRKAEVFIAVMGPIWGFGLALITGAVYLLTGNPLFAGVASWMSLLNLFNLLPINPLDGGRIMKTIAFSVNSTIALLYIIGAFLLSLGLAWKLHLWLVLLLCLIGMIETVSEYRQHKKRKKERNETYELVGVNKKMTAHLTFNSLKRIKADLTRSQILASGIVYLLIAGFLFTLMFIMSREPGAAVAFELLRS